jgi:hypothetical protein
MDIDYQHIDYQHMVLLKSKVEICYKAGSITSFQRQYVIDQINRTSRESEPIRNIIAEIEHMLELLK